MQLRPLGSFEEPSIATLWEFHRSTNVFLVHESDIISIGDISRPEWPSTRRNDENIVKTKRAIDGNCRKMINQISEETNVSRSTFMTTYQLTQL
ncbi:hypothetical protein TNCV_3057521 [Trichonephila clavipes]|nr:hypothetical protein TNCV_3057521 [Trichonephila clavipes]